MLKKYENVINYVQHALGIAGALWTTAVGGSLAYTRSRTPLKPSLRLIHARYVGLSFSSSEIT